ncbi:MAG: M20/M25/M40 family metallo-hydrolase, partial [Ruminococcus sp.]|nr:M20/M25/M40 family metallo-hydrolase [Ruminococcus sp.]
PGYTDTAVTAGKLGNHNCMSYGPGNLENAHQPDEFVKIKAIERCVKVYTELTKVCF